MQNITVDNCQRNAHIYWKFQLMHESVHKYSTDDTGKIYYYYY